MSTILKPQITEGGLQALFNASNNGVQARIKYIALGDSAYTPTQNQTALRNEKHRLSVASGKRITPTQIHVNVMDDSDKTFWVRELGFFLEDGTLFAVYAENGKTLAYKSPDVPLLLSFDLALSAVPANSITVIDQGLDINILIAPELAKMASAQIKSNHRFLQLKIKTDFVLSNEEPL